MPSARMVGLALGDWMFVFLLTIAVIAVFETLKRPVAFKHLEVVCLVGLLYYCLSHFIYYGVR